MLPFSSISNGSDVIPFGCFFIGPGRMVSIILSLIHVVTLIPLCTYILCLGVQQLQKKNPNSSAARISHCDIFTYHMVVMELIGVLGFILCIYGNYMTKSKVLFEGLLLFSFSGYGQIFFHLLTCVERYLAVVHPIAYLRMKSEKGIRIRNVTIAGVWLLCLGFLGYLSTGQYIYLDTFLGVISTIIIYFCCVSVLLVLIHPGPSQKRKERVEQSKQRAFYIIVVILGVLMLKLSYTFLWAGLDFTGNIFTCLALVGSIIVNLPSSLILPLLFLQRTGKCMCCKK